MSKEILLISSHPEDVSFLAQVTSVTGHRMEIAPDAKAAIQLLENREFSSIFLNVDEPHVLREFESGAQKTFGLFSDRIDPNRMHMVCERELSETRDIILSPFFGSFYQRRTDNVIRDGLYYGRFVKASEAGIQQSLSMYLDPVAAVQKVTLTHTSQKLEAVEAMREYLIEAKVPARIANIIGNAVDELIMNAMFDAPVDEFGKTLYSSTARSVSRTLQDHEKVDMSIGFDGQYVGVSVADRFGSIDRGRLLRHISANYRERDYTIRMGQAGAGLGLATIFNSGGSLIYHCEAKNRTEATLLYRASQSYREFKNQFRFFSSKFYV